MLSQSSPLKPVISVCQALLILVDKYKDNPGKQVELKRLYFLGADSKENRQKIESYLKDSALEPYSVSTVYKVTNEDPTRRYFETHLAYETLRHNLTYLNSLSLGNHISCLYKFLPDDLELRKKIGNVFCGSHQDFETDTFAREYNDAIVKINSSPAYRIFSKEEKNKLIMIMQIAYLSIIINWINKKLPIAIDDKGLFHQENRGRITKPNQLGVRSRNYGPLRSYMPTPQADIARAESSSTHLRPADLYSFNLLSQWTEKNFEQLVHPFSCSISGTILAQLRVFKALADQNHLVFNAIHPLSNYFRCFISVLLYHSGGHSFNEFTAPFVLPQVKEAFNFMDGFEMINLESLILFNNRIAFDTALERTREYNSCILARSAVHGQLVSRSQTSLRQMIAKVKTCINRYEAGNKKHLVDEFNSRLQHIDIHTQSENPDSCTVKKLIIKELEELDQKNNSYYGGYMLFGNSRSQNSTLKQLIGEAKEILNKNSGEDLISTFVAL